MLAQQAMANPQVQAMAAQNPEQAHQIVEQGKQQLEQMQQQAQQKLQQLQQEVTIDQVVKLLREERIRGFVLDIETDSTIKPDEDATKQRASEFITAVGGFMGQAFPLVQQVPQAATLASEMLKYVANQFRAGRELSGVIEEFADDMKQASQQQKPDPVAMQAQADAEAKKAELTLKKQDQDARAKIDADKLALDQKKHDDEMAMRKGELEHAQAQQENERVKADAEASFNAVVEHAKRNSEGEQFDRTMKANGDAAMTKAGLPPDYSFKEDRAMISAILADTAATRDAVTKAMVQISEQSNAVVTGLSEVAAVMAAPKRIVKDAAGRPAGIEIDKKSIN
jgi:hypothetical protein